LEKELDFTGTGVAVLVQQVGVLDDQRLRRSGDLRRTAHGKLLHSVCLRRITLEKTILPPLWFTIHYGFMTRIAHKKEGAANFRHRQLGGKRCAPDSCSQAASSGACGCLADSGRRERG